MNNVCWSMGRGMGVWKVWESVLGCGKVWEEVWGRVREVWKSMLGCGGD